jgi:catechol 2,3-dioxygenase-like lactoylglutathione lyase family enzyme
MIRVLAFLGGLLVAAPLAFAEPPIRSVDRVVLPVSQLDRAVAFFRDALAFSPQGGEPAGTVLHLGRETIELAQRRGRPVPPDSRSNDGWFQHLAIVVSDIDAAYARVLRAGAIAISTAPQVLPAWNPNAAGIRAVYFRDPDGHPLELIQYPPGKGEPRWQDGDRLFLGIDHTAIAAADTARSVAFYRDQLGLRVAGGSENWGIEQDRLSGVSGARVRITSLRAAAGPGIELLQYVAPDGGRKLPSDTTPNDLWADQIVLRIDNGRAVRGETIRDPDGHALRVAATRREVLR